MNDDLSWRPSATIDNLRKRAALLAQVRSFFNQRSYLEVETPYMAQHGVTDIYLTNIKAYFRGRPYYLQTSPEYHMKRLLAAGSGPIFQIARVFRDDEMGRWHNPEFSLLEWYQLGIDHHALMVEVDLLLQSILHSRPMIKKTYKEAFLEICDIDPFVCAIDDLKTLLKNYQLQEVLSADEDDKDMYLFLLMSHVIEPALAEYKTPVAVYDFPASQASLARVEDEVAARFEVYYQGVELANGFYELTDPSAQAKRFALDQEIRAERGLEPMQADKYLIEALEWGVPDCSGVALGLDRLFALALGQRDIASVLSFDCLRA